LLGGDVGSLLPRLGQDSPEKGDTQ